jgi:hypothetical protein
LTLARRRAAAQLLHRPASANDAVEIARHVAGVQAQDRFAGPLQFRSRSRKLTAGHIDAARTEERSLVRTWAMRMTVHLLPADDVGWMLPLFEPIQERWMRRRLVQLGLPEQKVEKALGVVEKALADGPITRAGAAEAVEAAGIKLTQQTRLHLVGTATVSGMAIQGPDFGASPSLVLRREWLGEPPPFDRDAALAELARRYLRGFGPATERDFARWAGLPLRDIRAGLAAIASEITEETGEGKTLLSLKGAKPRLPKPGQLRLLGAFDTYLLGYDGREFLSPEHHERINPLKGGMIEPAVVSDGELLAVWKLSRAGGKLEAKLDPHAPLDDATLALIRAEVEDIGRFEGKPASLA